MLCARLYTPSFGYSNNKFFMTFCVLFLKDTLEEVSISEGELLIQDSPLARLLVQIRTPPNDDAKVHGMIGPSKDRSEGEISAGEEIVDDEKSDVLAREKRIANDFNVG